MMPSKYTQPRHNKIKEKKKKKNESKRRICWLFRRASLSLARTLSRFIESRRLVENVFGLSSEWNILRPYAKKGKRACKKISARYSPSLHHFCFTCELCNESNKHTLVTIFDVPVDSLYNLSKSSVGKRVLEMMLFRKELHVCLLRHKVFMFVQNTRCCSCKHTHMRYLCAPAAATRSPNE